MHIADLRKALLVGTGLALLALPAQAQQSQNCQQELNRLQTQISSLSGQPAEQAKKLSDQARTAVRNGNTDTCQERITDIRDLLKDSGQGSASQAAAAGQAPQPSGTRPSTAGDQTAAQPSGQQQGGPDVRVTQPAPQVTVTTPAPEVTVRQPEPQVTVDQPEPQVTVQQAKPDVTVEQKQAEVQVKQQEPDVNVRRPADQNRQAAMQGDDRAQGTSGSADRMQNRSQTAQTGDQTQNGGQANQGSRSSATATTAENPLYSMRAEEIIGKQVVGARGEEVGEVSDVVIGQRDKQPSVVVSVGGFLGIGDKNVAIPLDDLQMTANNNFMVENFTKERVEAMPEYQENNYRAVERNSTVRDASMQ